MKHYQFDKESIDPYFSSLTETELSEVVNHFHALEISVPQIMIRYGLKSISVHKFTKRLPPILDPSCICPHCNEVSHVRHEVRGRKTKPYCPECGTDLYETIYPGNNEMFKMVNSAIDQFQSKESIEPSLILSKEDFEKLDIYSKIFIKSLIGDNTSKKLITIERPYLSLSIVVPNISLLDELMEKLGIKECSSENLHFDLKTRLVMQIYDTGGELNLSLTEKFELWRYIALNEVIGIFHFTLNEEGLYSRQNEKIKHTLSDLLRSFSSGEITSIIREAVAREMDVLSEGERTNQHTANVIIYTCKNIANYKKRNPETLDNVERPVKYLQSEMSKYVYEHVLKIGDRGFSEVPSFEELSRNEQI